MALRVLAMLGLSALRIYSLAMGDMEAEPQECSDEETSLLQVGSNLQGEKRLQPQVHFSAVGNESFPVKGSKTPMPARGFITCCNPTITKPMMLASLKAYLQAGGRLIDTAPDYGKEDVVGDAVIASGVPRKDIWVSTKVDTDGWTADQGDPRAWVLKQVDTSLKTMKLTYADVITLHFGPAQVALQKSWIPSVGAAGRMGPAEFTEMWRGLIEARKSGKVLNIGVCESTRSQIESLIFNTGVEPAVVVTEYNPWLPPVQENYVKWAQSKGMAVVAYALFAFKSYPPWTDATIPSGVAAAPSYSGASAVKAAGKVGRKHGVKFGQIAIKWILENKVGFITGLYHPQYLTEDLQSLPFTLDADDHKMLASVPRTDCGYNAKRMPQQYLPGCMP